MRDKTTFNEKFHSNVLNFLSHHLLDNLGSKSMDENASYYNDPQSIHGLNEGLCHSVPMRK